MLKAKAIHSFYGKSHILQGVSIHLEQGNLVCLLGRNGVGKSTTLKSIMGIVPPRGGRITFEGQNITGLAPHLVARRRIAWVPEERRILGNLTVLENLKLSMLYTTREGTDTAAHLEDTLRLFPRLRERLNQRGKTLSGGEQQMLAIARGLVAQPALMLVDEPTEGLMPLVVRQLQETLRAINAQGTAILLVEQNTEIALGLARRVYLIDRGRIPFEGSPGDLRGKPELMRQLIGV